MSRPTFRALLACASVSFAAAVGLPEVAAAGEDADPIAVPAFQWHSLLYRPATSDYVLAWSETNPEAVVARRVHQEYAAVNLDGGCPATWIGSWTISASSGLRIHGYAANRCYRWVVTLINGDGVARSATSRPLRILPAWFGTLNLYRTGVFSTQQTWTWCTAAAVQMVVNVVRHRTVHSKAEQQQIMTYEQAHDRYPVAVVGSDPQGEAAALVAFGAGTYRIVKSSSFSAAVRSAVTRMRLTGKPVALFVAGGNHAWVLNGFSATRDPAVTTSFTVTAVYVMGPLYPTQKYRNGYYDPPPNTRYVMTQFSKVLTPYHDTAGRAYSIWEGGYVTIQP